MDLTRAFPRSPYDMLAGMVMLGRTTDKARALLADGLGDTPPSSVTCTIL